ncbi:MAG: PAS domain S-box protein [Elusimicrobiota bacterium]
MKLQTKFLSLLFPAGVAAAGLILLLIQRTVHRAIMNDLVTNVMAVAKAAAQDAAPGFAAAEESVLLPQLQVLQNREGALYVAALDTRGRFLAHTTITEKGAVLRDPTTLAALRSDQPTVNAVVASAKPTLEVAVPVWAAAAPSRQESFLFSGEPHAGPRARLGLLKLSVPLGPELEIERRIFRGIVLIIAACGAVAAGFVVLLVRGVLKPVSGLMAGIAQLAKGRYDVSVPVASTDELGELAASFNGMSAELARTTVSKNYVEGILENMLDMLVVTDNEGNIETVNKAMIGALSYSTSEIVGRPLASIFRNPPDGLRHRELTAFAADGGIRDLEVSLQTRSGRAVPALFSASVLKDREGRVRGYIGVAKDITERKRSEEALVAAKTAAELSNKELEAFSYSVAHDLRAPLRAVDGFSQVVLEKYSDRLDDQGRDYLRRVRAGSRRMGDLIDDLLNLSRITRGALRVENVDMTLLARQIAAELRKSQPERRPEFVIAEGVTAEGDANLLRVAMVNLLTNSWKYTSKHAAARIEFGTLPLAGRKVYFVRDDGAGFDMAFSKKLFKPFNRLHAPADFEGNGIGLATVQRVVERHGGRVWGEGAVEKGATFYFTLGEGRDHGHEGDPSRRG